MAPIFCQKFAKQKSLRAKKSEWTLNKNFIEQTKKNHREDRGAWMKSDYLNIYENLGQRRDEDKMQAEQKFHNEMKQVQMMTSWCTDG